MPSAVAQLILTSRPLAGESVTANVIVPGSSAEASPIESFELLSSLLIVPVAVLTTAPVVGFTSSSLNDSFSSSSVSPLTLMTGFSTVDVVPVHELKTSGAPPTSVKSEAVAVSATVR